MPSPLPAEDKGLELNKNLFSKEEVTIDIVVTCLSSSRETLPELAPGLLVAWPFSLIAIWSVGLAAPHYRPSD